MPSSLRRMAVRQRCHNTFLCGASFSARVQVQQSRRGRRVDDSAQVSCFLINDAPLSLGYLLYAHRSDLLLLSDSFHSQQLHQRAETIADVAQSKSQTEPSYSYLCLAEKDVRPSGVVPRCLYCIRLFQLLSAAYDNSASWYRRATSFFVIPKARLPQIWTTIAHGRNVARPRCR